MYRTNAEHNTEFKDTERRADMAFQNAGYRYDTEFQNTERRADIKPKIQNTDIIRNEKYRIPI
jgi:hypothetical protein